MYHSPQSNQHDHSQRMFSWCIHLEKHNHLKYFPLLIKSTWLRRKTTHGPFTTSQINMVNPLSECIILLIQINMTTLGEFFPNATHLHMCTGTSQLPSTSCLIWSLVRNFWRNAASRLTILASIYFTSIVQSSIDVYSFLNHEITVIPYINNIRKYSSDPL